MYNRYVPQPDGTYRRNRIQDPQRQPMQTLKPTNESRNGEAMPPRPEEPQQQIPAQPYGNRNDSVQQKRQNKPPSSAGSFLRQLLPSDFDTEDLLVVILLLLMAGDSQDDRNSALLTLALYLFL